MKSVKLKLCFSKDLEKHIKDCQTGPYVGADGTDVLDMAKNYNAHLDHWTFTAIAYLIRHRARGNSIDLLKASHLISRLYEREE
ncbi:MAG: hypothetical protein DDT19_02668 [Syntrophomonadaceae bacterium]|nr:hypothetical protein [Bacillota bacterium]